MINTPLTLLLYYSTLYMEYFSFTPVLYHINSKMKSVKEVDIHATDE